jgi:hypothetical protein
MAALAAPPAFIKEGRAGLSVDRVRPIGNFADHVVI